jgi:hypothetical protein
VIRDYFGHASVATTSRYITINLQMKRDVLETLRGVYPNDALTREQELSAEERLRFHQEHSGPVFKSQQNRLYLRPVFNRLQTFATETLDLRCYLPIRRSRPPRFLRRFSSWPRSVARTVELNSL